MSECIKDLYSWEINKRTVLELKCANFCLVIRKNKILNYKRMKSQHELLREVAKSLCVSVCVCVNIYIYYHSLMNK